MYACIISPLCKQSMSKCSGCCEHWDKPVFFFGKCEVKNGGTAVKILRNMKILAQFNLKGDWIHSHFPVPFFPTSSHSLSFPNLTTKLINTSLRSSCFPDAARCSDRVSDPSSTQLNFCQWLVFVPFSHSRAPSPLQLKALPLKLGKQFLPRARKRQCQPTHMAALPLLGLSQFCWNPVLLLLSPSTGLFPGWPCEQPS